MSETGGDASQKTPRQVGKKNNQKQYNLFQCLAFAN